jgi:hypothetical protein
VVIYGVKRNAKSMVFQAKYFLPQSKSHILRTYGEVQLAATLDTHRLDRSLTLPSVDAGVVPGRVAPGDYSPTAPTDPYVPSRVCGSARHELVFAIHC